ncbi:MAG TPA: cytochrome c4 [Methyloprofundus sp.]|uniref:c-type cytochrome n=1 Tax=Methyloprofundus sp. TaxID=2020875 RepID=UPI00180357B7|nr:c-type cytochrome [Methyloprofundus sp.]HIG65220.1 cytochrome c4 [Methyloprofundus sp.]HIL79355.1 cytochrome c4 [Methylococcales bacterium]
MKKSLIAVSISFTLLNMPGVAQAVGDIGAGQVKSGSCASCHGADGNSMMPLFPKLAEQNEDYLVKQLEAFKDGSRSDTTMNSMVVGLSEQDMQDIAAFYAAQAVSENPLPQVNPDDLDDIDDDNSLSESAKTAAKQALQDRQKALMTMGYDVYRNGNLDNEISACIACHGPNGEGNEPAAFPALKGQHAGYLAKTLTDFKTDKRSNNPDNMMHMIAKKMNEEEITAISYYVSAIK